MTIRNVVLVLSLALSTAAFSSCSKNKEQTAYAPLVVSMKQEAAKSTAAIQSLLPEGQTAISTEVTLRKASLFNRTFLFGSSLQFSSVKEDDINVTQMAINIGQIPANFVIVDDKLRLMSDSRLNFESDVNHPSELVHEFPILRQDADTITIRAEQASPQLEPLLSSLSDKKPQKLDSIIRSMEYSEKDELFLIESSIAGKDGSVAEFMETLTPRDHQVAADQKVIYNDADLNPLADRFRFLDAGKVFVDQDGKRVQTKVANRFILKNGEPIKWYVTRNVDQKYLGDIKNAVEGWNRYSRAAGQPDIIRFEGLVPEGVKVGDPRYNLIVWDTVQDAGAAYESQNADPLSGVQASSMIYVPFAWVNIGKQYWENGVHSEASEAKTAAMTKLLKSRKFMGRSLPVNCIDEADLHVSAKAKQSPEEFARGLLKGVIFHEVGHSLGLAHNFKGSLSFDPDKSDKLFSTSIMDYNHYNEEEAAFANLDTSDGPLLEYDRQIISELYYGGKDVKDSDATLPACADEEADSFAGGVDPLCVRYDIGSDPTKQALRSFDLIGNVDAHSGMMGSLPKAILDTARDLGNPADAKTVDDVKKALAKITTVVNGTVNMYVGGTANSFAYLGSQAMKSLYVFRGDVLPEGYDENEMRSRALTVLESAVNANALPASAKDALAQVRAAISAYLLQTQAVAGLDDAKKAEVMKGLMAAVDKAFAKTEISLLSKARTRILGGVAYHQEAPISFLTRNGQAVDGEAAVLSALETLASAKAGETDRPAAERLASIKVIADYAKAGIGKDVVARIRENLNVEIRSSTDAVKRANLRTLLAALPQ